MNTNTFFSRVTLLGTALAGIGFSARPAAAALIDVDFSPGGNVAQSGAAVVGAAGDVWNNFNGSSGTGVALNDVAGASTGVTLTYASNFGGDDTGNSPMDAATVNLMRDFLAMNGQAIVLSGLAANTPYQLVLYGAGSQATLSGNPIGGQGTTFTIPQGVNPSLVGKTTEVNPTTPTLGDRKISDGAGVAYTILNPTSSATGGLTINIAFNSNAFSTAPVNGFQLQSVPEPTILGLAAVGCVGGLVRRRRRA